MEIIKPLSSVSIGSDFVGVYQKTLKNVVLSSKNTPSRVLFLRPSQLPFCPVEFFVNHASRGLFRDLDMAGAFYTSVGTIVHEVMQDYLCTSGRFLADYHCRECGTWHRHSYVHECCDFPTKYHEIEISWKGITGHIDAVYRDKKGRLWILDFKTTSVKTAPVKKKNPGVQYIEQIETYAVLFELQYKQRIEGIMDAFIVRDNPKLDPIIYSRTLTDQRRRVVRTRLARYKKLHQEVLDVQTLKEAMALIKYDRCTNPYCKVCKMDSEVMRNKVKNAFKQGLAKGNVPIRAMAEREVSRAAKFKNVRK
jgi:hypothetical protein